VTLRLFDTATRTVRDFVPLVPGEVGIYLCGATVQAPPHIGHLRSAIAFDVLVRWLRRTGHRVTLVRNVTDIDDKILAKAADAGEPWWAWATANERAFTAAYDALGVLPPSHEPRATGHVPAMIELMDRLVETGHAYPTGPGDVWFDVRSYPEYGALTNQRVDDMVPAPDGTVDDTAKRDPRDFALWKAAKPGEPTTAAWDTPFGRGRPGWHLECSAMARKYLGDTFDVHGGGVDLRFPHHENEMAQSRAAGLGFANYWLHNAWVTQGGEKMSKSLGNSLRVSEVLHEHRPVAVRYYLTAAHYRSTIEYHPGAIEESATAVERIEGFLRRALPGVVTAVPAGDEVLPDGFREAMDDDLGVSGALAEVHEAVRAGNTALDDGDTAEAAATARVVVAMTDVLGVNPLDPAWAAGDSGSADALASLDALVKERLAARAHARSARDYDTADAIRDELAAAGIVLEDTAAGVRWSLARGRSE
jgi:cysteinyl-tRNA synthetase